MSARVPSGVLAALVVWAVLAPGSVAFAHREPAGQRGAVVGAVGVVAPTAQERTADGPAPTEADTQTTLGSPWSAALELGGPLVLLAALAGLAGARFRRMIAGLAVAILAVLAFETGVHSAHHLGDESGASRCSVASTTTQLAGTPAAEPALSLPALARTEPSVTPHLRAAAAPLRCTAPRGPPGPLTA